LHLPVSAVAPFVEDEDENEEEESFKTSLDTRRNFLLKFFKKHVAFFEDAGR
jgi:hypothetical protein